VKIATMTSITKCLKFDHISLLLDQTDG
jgi:hypothetical protein